MNSKTLARWGCAFLLGFALLSQPALQAADLNSLGVSRPRNPRPEELAPRYRPSRVWNSLLKFEARAEEKARGNVLQEAAPWWGSYYHTAVAGAATTPEFANHAVYAAQTLVALYLKVGNTKTLNVESLANSVKGVVAEIAERFSASAPGLLRARLSPEVDRFLNFYGACLETGKSGTTMSGWPYRPSFDTAIEIRRAFSRFDPQKAAQHWQLEFIYAQALCRFLQATYEQKEAGGENLLQLQQVLATAGKLRFKSAEPAHSALMAKTLDGLHISIQKALTANQTGDADALFREVITLTKDREEWQERPLAMALELESGQPGFGKRYVETIRAESRKLPGAEPDPVHAFLERKATSAGINALTIEVRDEKRRALEESGRAGEALQLDQLTVEQCVKALEGDLGTKAGALSLLQGMKEASVRLGRALKTSESGLSPTDAHVELLAQVARMLVDRTFIEAETPEILRIYADVASLVPVSSAARSRIDFEICRMNWIAHKTDYEGLDRVRKSLLDPRQEPAPADAAMAYFFAALSAEKAAQWKEVDEFVGRSLQASGIPKDQKARAWQVERMLMRALALRHTKGPAEEELLLKEVLTVAGQCEPAIAPAIRYAVGERLRRLKTLSPTGGPVSSPQESK